MAFVPGYSQGATFKLTGQVSATTLAITAHSWEESCNLLETTNSTTGGIAQRIAGVLDGQGTIELNVDAASPTWAGANAITAGAVGVATFSVGTGSPYSVPAIVEKVSIKSAINALVTLSVDIKLNGAAGAYVRGS